ncbi:hypothetical protein KDU71_07465 [Carboxylicivirga sediminis]|uniref:Uncharacterized protein n=1 Tax=Carboxylicivirga sediminis TaxID=2006564 RepID=A0A941IXH5_9BACT|nr:hypothetical protein [Carboxylicivirga sediminis]MBR8535394.1 hypothetical protein [Carboxylicivirga sediminis]
MQFVIKNPDPIKKELWPEESVYKLTGGFTFDRSVLKDGVDMLEKGALFAADYANKTAKLVKTAKLHANATNAATDYQVGKNHQFKVGEYFAATKGGAAYAITAVDTSNAAYDVITLGTTLGVALTAADDVVFFESSAEGADVAAEKNVANTVLIHDQKLEEHNAINLAARIFEIIESKLPYAVHALNKTSLGDRFLFV